MKTSRISAILLLGICLTFVQDFTMAKSVRSKVSKRGCAEEADPEEETEKREVSTKHQKDELEEENTDSDAKWEVYKGPNSLHRRGSNSGRKKRTKKVKSKDLNKRADHCNIGGVLLAVGESRKYDNCYEYKCEPGPEALDRYIC